jgi:hypothetical protein
MIGQRDRIACGPHSRRQRRLLNQLDDLQLLGGGVSHASSSPTPITVFQRQLGDNFLYRAGLAPQLIDLLPRSRLARCRRPGAFCRPR